MTRAGIFIGVDQTGELQKLKDAAAGAKRMYEWALSQGMVSRGCGRVENDPRGNSRNAAATFIGGISGANVPAGIGVAIDTNAHLGTAVSSERFKDDIQPLDKSSEAILRWSR